MRIGYYIPAWPPGSTPNGIVTTYGYLGQRLREMGNEVYYVTASSNAKDPWVTVIDPFNERSLVDKIRFRFSFENAHFSTVSNSIARAVEKLVQNNGLEIFQMEDTHGWARTVVCRVPIPVVVRLDGPWFLHAPLNPLGSSRPPNTYRIKREGEALHVAAGVTAPSKDVLSRSVKFYGQPRCPAIAIPSPIPLKPDSRRWRLDSCDRDLILFVGRFDLHKGADILLRAFTKLAQDRPAIKLVYIGPDVGLPSNDGRTIKLAEYIDREIPLAVRQRIDYRGLASFEEIEKFRTEAYLTVVPSRYETFGNTVIEAMATGCPTIATDTGGIPEIITNNRNGLLFPIEDVNGLVAAISRLLDDPNLAVMLGSQAAHDCSELFDPTNIAQQVVEFYSAVIARHKISSR